MRLLLLLFFLPLLIVLSLSIGAYRVYVPWELMDVALNGSAVERAILEYRAWRTLSAAILGAGLAAAGLTMQRILANPMADPYVLGISSGAALFYLLSIAIGISSVPLWYLSAFAGGSLTFLLVIGISWALGMSSLALVVAGIAISYMFSGLSVTLMILLGPQLPFAISWLFGSVAYAERKVIIASTAITVLGIAIIFANRRGLTSLLVGEDVSAAHGVNVRVLRLSSSIASALIVTSLVTAAGPVGFIGLTAPWMSRFLIGSSFSSSLAASLLIGALLGLAADVAVRLIGGGAEIPLTAITSLVGAPLLVYLSVKGGAGRL